MFKLKRNENKLAGNPLLRNKIFPMRRFLGRFENLLGLEGVVLDGDGAALLVVDREHLVFQQVCLRITLVQNVH